MLRAGCGPSARQAFIHVDLERNISLLPYPFVSHEARVREPGRRPTFDTIWDDPECTASFDDPAERTFLGSKDHSMLLLNEKGTDVGKISADAFSR